MDLNNLMLIQTRESSFTELFFTALLCLSNICIEHASINCPYLVLLSGDAFKTFMLNNLRATNGRFLQCYFPSHLALSISRNFIYQLFPQMWSGTGINGEKENSLEG